MAKHQPQRNLTQAQETGRIPFVAMTLSAAAAAVLTGVVFVAAKPKSIAPSAPNALSPPSLTTAATLAALLSTPDLPADSDPALLNLACCPALPADPTGAAIAPYLKTLDHWADAVAETTRRNHHRYLENPKEFASEPEWKLAMMCTVIGQDFKVRYDPTLTSTTQQLASNGVFFANPHAVFLTGCLNDSRSGTCASLPVLYVAIGRRLGYPMYLVTAKSHVFARWDDGHGVVVNLEAANSGGFTSHPDSHYRTWPRPISAAEEQAGSYLKNLTPVQTLALFLSIRADTLQAAGKNQDAIAAAATAYRLPPRPHPRRHS